MSKSPETLGSSTAIELSLYPAGGSPLVTQTSKNANDSITLTRLGKKPVLKRRFGLTSIIAFGCLVQNTWGGVSQLLGIGLLNGGPAGLVYGWIVVWFGTFATFACLAELASLAPTSGGQYHWVSILAPSSIQKFASYVTGWLTVLGWQAAVAASVYISGTMIQALIELVHPSYIPKLWHGTLLLYAVLALCVLVTIVLGKTLPAIETVLMIIYILGFFGVMVPMVSLASPHASANTVFTMFVNNGGWNSQSLSFVVGLSGSAFVMLGADSAVHMSEEVRNAATTVPRAMIISLIINGLVGFAMLIAELFCIQDVEALLALNLQYPFVQIFVESTRSTTGSAIMLAINIFNSVSLDIGNVTAASRMLWSFSRDRGIPGWRVISKVDQKNAIPINSILVTTSFSIIVGLISIGSPIAFNDIISLSIDGLYTSYLLACGLLLWRRCTRTIKTASELELEREVSLELDVSYYKFNAPGSEGRLVWGPFRMPRALGIATNVVACLYMIIILFFSLWPPVTPTTAAGMNYSVLMFGAVSIFSTIYYVGWARRTYEGPLIEISNGFSAM